jgi:uncharacterized secreted protein with C-terminal beta-propeller domain
MAIEESVMFDSAGSEGMAVPSSAVVKTQSGGTDYSTTNVQVENVDEPDYLKNE